MASQRLLRIWLGSNIAGTVIFLVIDLYPVALLLIGANLVVLGLLVWRKPEAWHEMRRKPSFQAIPETEPMDGAKGCRYKVEAAGMLLVGSAFVLGALNLMGTGDWSDPGPARPALLVGAEPVHAVSFPRRGESPRYLAGVELVDNLVAPLREAVPLPRQKRPVGEPDLIFCLLNQPQNGPCIEYWASQNLLKGPPGYYEAPAGFGALLRTSREQAQ